MTRLGTVLLIIGLFSLLVSMFMAIFPSSRKFAGKLALASIVILLIGASICSMFPIRIGGNPEQYEEEEADAIYNDASDTLDIDTLNNF